MIVVTAMLIFATLFFAPIRFRVDAFVYLQRLSASFAVKIGVVTVFDEDVFLAGKYLRCSGTVKTEVDVTTVNRKNGVDLLKCITLDKLCLSLQNNILNVSMFYIALQNAFVALVTATLCKMFHCQFYNQVVGTLNESRVKMQVCASTSVAAVSICLVKQGVRQWITRKSEK